MSESFLNAHSVRLMRQMVLRGATAVPLDEPLSGWRRDRIARPCPQPRVTYVLSEAYEAPFERERLGQKVPRVSSTGCETPAKLTRHERTSEMCTSVAFSPGCEQGANHSTPLFWDVDLP